jgi:large subunit ribosomal protein L19e|tara:strand:+ start:360 stop:776 length:417 start_codon:yes stop_codon:yes gene_type:complete
MNLGKKKNLASRTLGIGKKRIVFLKPRLSEIKDVITKQDIRDLKTEGAIVIKDVKGRKKKVDSKRKRGPGKVKKNVSTRKQDYVIMTRKLRAYVKNLRDNGKISKEKFYDIRKKIRNKAFKSKAHLKENLKGTKNENN